MVEEMLAARGIVVSHETVRQWALKFGQEFANRIRRRRLRAGDNWHLDEGLTLSGKSGGRRESCETSDACLGQWYAIEPAYYP